MTKIHGLTENLTNQIAAGEVIERPSSIVKELVENSIDAGSTQISVNFVKAGLAEITVQDNGNGISAEEIDLAFMRHATSKISNERDLFQVKTLGFRGEALASIAAVSRVEMLTKTSDGLGQLAVYSGGQKLSQTTNASQDGTKITVSKLFFNTPARLKYLKSEKTEAGKIVDLINRLALGHPDIAFTLTNHGKKILQTPGNGNLQQTLALIYGRSVASKMQEFSGESAAFKIWGYTSDPDTSRSNQTYITLLINGRYVKNRYLNNAIVEGYGGQLMNHHYPICVMNLAVNPMLVDVNVHPTKEEVRLSKEQELARLITSTLKEVVKPTQSALENLDSAKQVDVQAELAFQLNDRVIDTTREVTVTPVETKEDDHYILTDTWAENVKKQTQLSPFSTSTDELVTNGEEKLTSYLPNLTYQGKFLQYLLANDAENLYLIDATLARKRLNYDELLAKLTHHQIVESLLLAPMVLEFGSADYQELVDQLDKLKKLGFDLEDFGQNSLLLRSYPNYLQGDETEFRHLFDLFIHEQKTDTEQFFKVIAKEASDHLVKKELKEIEAQQLLQDLRFSQEPYRYVDGKIIIVKLTAQDFQKMFHKR